MCEYCGCQALATIEELTREHDLVLSLMGEVRAAHAHADPARMAELARQIAAVLAPHTEVEENGLFPALAADFPDHVATLRAEHRQVEAVLSEASAGDPADLAWPARLVAALRILREHIFKEQDGVFPAALTTLTAAEWEAAEAVRSRVGRLLPAHGN
ncbi:MAG TPA: hemerythrin domain-containing protein [Streptosporangiaceae bacterium]